MSNGVNPYPIQIFPAASYSIGIGGSPVAVIPAGMTGGLIVNPAAAYDQGIAFAEDLYVDVVNPAIVGDNATCVALVPGQSYWLPTPITNPVTVNAATAGHSFSVICFQSSFGPLAFEPYFGTFPPNAPTSLLNTIPSYLYQEYTDDSDLQAFVASYNELTQLYVDWFNSINLPYYPGDIISGTLLDWVGGNLYGDPRPVLMSGKGRTIGPLNTWALNTIAINKMHSVGPPSITVTTDEIYKRILTWNFYKGDGNTFSIRWLKRRVMRFLIGEHGTAPDIPNTYQISVTMSQGVVSIRILSRIRRITSSALFNAIPFNVTPKSVLNSIHSQFTQLPTFDYAPIFVQAMNSGALQIPVGLTFRASIS